MRGDRAGLGLTAAMTLAAGAVGITWWMNSDGLTPTERLLFEKIDDAIASNPPKASKIDRAFDLTMDCKAGGCFYKSGSIGDLRFQWGDLRQSDDGLIFHIEELSGECVRTRKAVQRFGTGAPEQSCSHGGCWYTKTRHPWGILGFGIEEPDSICISSLVVNSEPYQRNLPVNIEVEGRVICVQNCEVD